MANVDVTVGSGRREISARTRAPVSVASSHRQRSLRVKRVVDVVVSSIAIVVLAPVMLAIAIAIRLSSSGPVLFAQTREGLMGRPFDAYKFRSMLAEEGHGGGPEQTGRNDPRITPLGRFLRRTSLDELPQLFNVLMGEMSLVGPRPHVKNMEAGGMSYRQLVPYYDARLAVLPGLTGWAQANGLRGYTDDADLARARIDYDLAYIEHFSVWLDIRILVLTLRHEFLRGSGQ